MKDFVTKRVKYFCDYADLITSEFKKLRYGVAECCSKNDAMLRSIRYELAYWQSSPDFSSISTIKRNIKWKAFEFDSCPVTCLTINVIDKAAEAFKFDPAIAIWVINHSLPFNPNVTTTDLDGQEIQGTVQYINDSTINVVFSVPVSGWAYLS